PVDAIILDLEDAVAPDQKAAAREALVAVLEARAFGPRSVIVRINGLETEWGEDDLRAIAPAGPEAVLLPKVGRAVDVEGLAARLDGEEATRATRIWAMIETPDGILNAAEIARAPRMAGFVMGTNDLAKELRCRHVPGRAPLMTALQMALLAARAAGIICVDGVFNAFRDVEGLRAECEQGRDMGMDGKTLIHPAQVDVANEVFAPTPEEVELARRQIEAFEAATKEGKGVAVVDGRIVESLHVETARQTLARVAAIEALRAATE
ncbi:MAG: CoA ester lyase, partial [Alphaproteobacteria bacterium]